ncbi:MAG: hypothetical protein PGN13_03480 [Patulibacter minatonensis]
MTSSTTEFDQGRVRDLDGRAWHPWTRRALIALMTLFVVIGLTGAFGQVQHTRTASTAAALVKVRTPETLRGGLYWPTEIRIDAHQRITAPTIVLGSGFIRGMQLNTVEPAPASESSRGGRVALTYPTLEPGDALVVHLQLQVNPTTVGEQDLGVRIDGADLPPIALPQTATVLP